MAILFCGFVCLPTFLAFGARLWWGLELATHFRVQYVVLTLPFVVWFAAARQGKLLVAPAFACVWNLGLILPLYLPATQPSSTGPRLRAVVANVHTGNREPQRFIEFIRQTSPDFFLAVEVDAGWMHALEGLKSEYPYILARPRSDNFGMAFFSRLPVETLNVVELADSEVPTVVAVVRTGAGPLTVIGTHPLPPTGSEYAAYRNRQFTALAELAASIEGPRLLLGDLNATSWSPQFADLLQATGLRDSRRGFGVQPSWPVQSPLLLIPIDHALVSEEIAVHERRIGDAIGSDHRPVVLELSLQK